jgi:hypothetical protein
VVIINSILFVTRKWMEEFGFSEKFVKTACAEYRKGLRPSYENIEVTPELRNQYSIDSSVRNLISYHSIPEATRTEKNMPSLAQLTAQINTTNLKEAVHQCAGLKLDKALNYFRSNPNTYPSANELSQHAIWLLFMAEANRARARSLDFDSIDDLYIACLAEIKTLEWTRWKVKSLQVLRRKLKPFLTLFKKPLYGNYSHTDFELALQSLVHKGFGNDNREKLGEEQESCIFSLYADGNAKLNETQVYALYLSKAAEKIAANEWTEDALVSLATLKNFLYRPEVKQAYWSSRYGRKEYRECFEVITRRRTASIANGMWVIDGTDWHRYYQEGNNAYARLNVFVVLDAHSWCVVGFYVSDSENSQQVIGALRAASQLSGFIPHQIQSDNGSAIGGYYGQHCINKIAKYYTPAAVGNARSKVIEPFFKQFNNKVQRFYPGFTHSPVMSLTLQGRPNREALQKALKEGKLVNKETAIRELHEAFGIWNRLPFKGGLSPLERYKKSIEASIDQQRHLSEAIKVEAFFTMPGEIKKIKGLNDENEKITITKFIPQSYQYTNGGIELSVDKQKHYFVIDNPEVNQWLIGRKVFLKYDPIDITKVYLYEPKDDHDFTTLCFNGQQLVANSTNQFAQAIIDYKPGERMELVDHLERKKLQEKNAIALADNYKRIAKTSGVFIEVNSTNAFPKGVLSAAKQELAERILTPEKTISNEITEHEISESEPVMVEPRHSVNLSRFDLD